MKLYFSCYEFYFLPNAKICNYNTVPDKVFRLFVLFRQVLNKGYFQYFLNF